MLAAGFAAAVQPIAAQTVIHTDSKGLVAGEVKIPVADGQIPAYRAMPEKGTNFPTVPMRHTGLTPISAPATVRGWRKTGGSGCTSGSGNTA